jgi:hypothetical protein
VDWTWLCAAAVARTHCNCFLDRYCWCSTTMLGLCDCAKIQGSMLTRKTDTAVPVWFVPCCAVQYCEQGGYGGTPCALHQLTQGEHQHTASARSTAQWL